MSVIRELNLLGQQRLDVPQLRSIESAVRGDFDLLAGTILSGKQPLIVKGFILTNTTVGAPATAIEVIVADSISTNYYATESGSMFVVPADRANEVLSSLNSKVLGNFTSSATNYVAVDIRRSADVTTTDSLQFLSATTLLETSRSVPLARTLDYVFVVSTTDFSSQPNLCPIAKVVTDASNNITSVVDARQLMFRLAPGGSFASSAGSYSWPGGRNESLSILDMASGDKSIENQVDWMKAAMSRIHEIGGGEFWYSATADRNVTMVWTSGTFANGENFEWVAGDLHWQGVKFLFDNSTGHYNTVANQPVDSAGLTDLADGECIYVDLVRGSNAALTAAKAVMSTLGPGSVSGARNIIAWRDGANIYTRNNRYPVGTMPLGVVPATTLANGILQLTRDWAGVVRAGLSGAGAPVAVSDRGGTIEVAGGTNHTGLIIVADGTGNGITATSGLGAGAIGVYGQGGNGATGTTGVSGKGGDGSGPGVYGEAGAGGSTQGVWGKGIGTSDVGVQGDSGTGASAIGVAGIGHNATATTGVYGYSGVGGSGVHGEGYNTGGTGVRGTGGVAGGTGVVGTGIAASSIGVLGNSGTGAAAIGVKGVGNTLTATTGVYGYSGEAGIGVHGVGYNTGAAGTGTGVKGTGGLLGGHGVEGVGIAAGTNGVKGTAGTGGSGAAGVYGKGGTGGNGTGVYGETGAGGGQRGVWGLGVGAADIGVFGTSGTGASAVGVYGAGDTSTATTGVRGSSGDGGIGVKGTGYNAGTGGTGVHGTGGSPGGTGVVGVGVAASSVGVSGACTTSGSGVSGAGGTIGTGVHGTGGSAAGNGVVGVALVAATAGVSGFCTTTGYGTEGSGGTLGTGLHGVGGTITGDGVFGTGGTSGRGGVFTATGNNTGVDCTGANIGAGGTFTAGATGASIKLIGNAGVPGAGVGQYGCLYVDDTTGLLWYKDKTSWKLVTLTP